MTAQTRGRSETPRLRRQGQAWPVVQTTLQSKRGVCVSVPPAGGRRNGTRLISRTFDHQPVAAPAFRTGIRPPDKEETMLRYAVIFLIVAIIAAILGFGGIAIISVEIAKILFFVFLVLFVITLVGHLFYGRRPPAPPV
jgi:uncharacterized membrane protein YtjA (UPF0391 family)